MAESFYEMTESEASLENIMDNLEFAHYQIVTGLTGTGNGYLTLKEINRLQDQITDSLENAMGALQELQREFCSIKEEEEYGSD